MNYPPSPWSFRKKVVLSMLYIVGLCAFAWLLFFVRALRSGPGPAAMVTVIVVLGVVLAGIEKGRTGS